MPVGGLAYFVSPPRSMQEVVTDPLHSIIYVVFILASCAMFSVVWIEVKRNCALYFVHSLWTDVLSEIS